MEMEVEGETPLLWRSEMPRLHRSDSDSEPTEWELLKLMAENSYQRRPDWLPDTFRQDQNLYQNQFFIYRRGGMADVFTCHPRELELPVPAPAPAPVPKPKPQPQPQPQAAIDWRAPSRKPPPKSQPRASKRLGRR